MSRQPQHPSTNRQATNDDDDDDDDDVISTGELSESIELALT